MYSGTELDYGQAMTHELKSVRIKTRRKMAERLRTYLDTKRDMCDGVL